jgi:hypothetical protein
MDRQSSLVIIQWLMAVHSSRPQSIHVASHRLETISRLAL